MIPLRDLTQVDFGQNIESEPNAHVLCPYLRQITPDRYGHGCYRPAQGEQAKFSTKIRLLARMQQRSMGHPDWGVRTKRLNWDKQLLRYSPRS